MRRHDREVTDEQELLAMLDRCAVVNVALNNGPYPYVVPLSFGWEKPENGSIALYVHGFNAGLRHDLAEKDPHVGVSLNVFDRYVFLGSGITCAYESLIGEGDVTVLHGEEAVHGLDLLCAHCGYPGFRCSESTLAHTSVWRITLKTLTGKKNDPQ